MQGRTVGTVLWGPKCVKRSGLCEDGAGEDEHDGVADHTVLEDRDDLDTTLGVPPCLWETD